MMKTTIKVDNQTFRLPPDLLIRDFGKSVVFLKPTTPRYKEFDIDGKFYRQAGCVQRQPHRSGGWQGSDGGLPTDEMIRIVKKLGGECVLKK